MAKEPGCGEWVLRGGWVLGWVGARGLWVLGVCGYWGVCGY